MKIKDIAVSYDYNKDGSYEAILENYESVPITSVQFKEMRDAYKIYDCFPYEYDGLRKVIYQHITPEMRAKVEVNPMIWEENDQTAKADKGKPRLSLVPTEIINCIARVREYAVNGKYKDPNNWKRVDVERYHDALFRHVIAYINDPKSVDEESGLPTLWHIACNVAFLCELEKDEK